MDVRAFTVGPIQENAYLVRRDGADAAVLVDPGAEPERLLAAIAELGVAVEAILITHTHFDHVGAVAALARATGAPVHCPAGERDVLAELPQWAPPEFGPYEAWDPEVLVEGGERLALAGLEIDVVATPGHSPAHVTYAIEDAGALLSGDVLFRGSIGRTDLPGADTGTLLASIAGLLERYDDATTVHPGHMGITTLGQERASNPFLVDLAPR